MVKIEIDDELFNYIKSLAEPFIDTPNSVLRRLLFHESQPQDSSTQTKTASPFLRKPSEAVSEMFTNSFLLERYGERFRTKSPFRTMFESDNYLIYFQNFNKTGTTNLWYRLSSSSLSTLRKTSKTAIVCFTNPSDGLIIEIPINDIDMQISKCSWEKDFLEVNIDPSTLRWRELDWCLQQYLYKSKFEEEEK